LLLAAPLAATSQKTSLSLKIKERTTQERNGAGRFTLPGASASDGDAGRVTFTESAGTYGRTSDGLQFLSYRRTETLTGKHGTLVIRTNVRVFQVGVIDQDDGIARGTWSIVRGSGEYAGLSGGGGLVGMLRAVAPHSEAHIYSYRYEGSAGKA
jgi:hypothetical protein